MASSPTDRRAWPVLAAIALAGLAALMAGCRDKAGRLPALGARLDQTSVSGISSGAYMAGQFQLAHSRIIVGAAIIAGGPYGCAESVYADIMPGPGATFLNLSKAVNGCMLSKMRTWGVPSPKGLAEQAERIALAGRIDPLEEVRGDRVYLFSGREDRTVEPVIVDAAVEFYGLIGVPREQLRLVADLPAGHGFVTEAEGQACERTAEPYINACGYDQAGELLTHIHGPLARRADGPTGELIAFDQQEFTSDMPEHGLDAAGFVYVPRACRGAAGCRVHVTFHGCGQARERIGDTFARRSGFARWAETNRLIVLFPQVRSSPINAHGCWDWWGYTGRDYLTQAAPQIRAVRRMLDRLASGGRASS